MHNIFVNNYLFIKALLHVSMFYTSSSGRFLCLLKLWTYELETVV